MDFDSGLALSTNFTTQVEITGLLTDEGAQVGLLKSVIQNHVIQFQLLLLKSIMVGKIVTFLPLTVRRELTPRKVLTLV